MKFKKILSSKFLFFILFLIFFLGTRGFASKKYDFSNWQSNFSAIGEKPFDYFGHSIATGDINGDGVEDILVGAYYADPNDRSGGGCAYVFFGEPTSTQQKLLNLAYEDADITIFGPVNNSQLGKAVAIGDINNDNYDDIIIAAPYHTENGKQARGAVYVIYGNDSMSSLYDLAAGGFDGKILGENSEDQFGTSLLAEDINHDNFADIIIAAPYADQSPKVNCGKIYVFWGSAQLPSPIDLSSQSADLSIVGESTNDKAGYSLIAGNVNGDNYKDLLIGAPSATPDAVQRSNAGIIYVIAGKASFASSIIELATSSEVASRLYGASSFSSIGKVVAAGDVNGDSYEDIIFTDFAGNNNKGSVGVVLGNTSFPPLIDFSNSSLNNIILGGELGGILGESLLAKDVNGDGFADIFIGVPGANTDNGNASGAVYVVKGKQFLHSTINLETDEPNEVFLGASAGSRFGYSMSILNYNEDSKKDMCFGAPEGGYSAGQIFTVLGGLPYMLNKNPQHKANKVDVDTTVYFELYDDDEGIDINSVHVILGGVEYTSSSPNFSYVGSPSKYSITITPVKRFGYDQIVDVIVNCDDLAGWHMPKESYYFRTREDTDAPYTADWVPHPDSTNVAVDADVTFHIYDAGEGVNINSVVVTINGVSFSVDSSNFAYSGTPNDYFVQIDPGENFSYGEVVNVAIDAADNAANANIMPTFRYSFTCVEDTIPPVVIDWRPANGDTISQRSTLYFEIIDIGAGVNENSISFFLDQTNLTPFIHISANSTGDGFEVSYTPAIQNYYSLGEHNLKVLAYDLAATPNMADTSITVICIPDTDPPYTQNHFPVKFETEAATNTKFEVDILDDLMGVDTSSIKIKLNGTEIMNSPTSIVSEIEDGYHIEYVPPTRLVGQVNVSIDASDFNNPPNVMPTENYTFTTVLDTVSPYLGNLDPQPNETNVAETKSIFLSIYDKLTGVDKSSILLRVNDVDVTSQTSIEKITKGYSLYYEPTEPFNYDATVKVEVTCQDLAITPNQLNSTYFFYIVPDTVPPYVQNMNPDANQVGVALNTNIYLEVVDDGFGVDSSSIRLYVNSRLVTPILTPLSSGNGFALEYDPQENFSYGQIVTVSVYASDMANPQNSMEEFKYSFRCIDDDTNPPFLTGLEPAAKEGVPVDTKISFKLLDAENGIDFNSIIFKINNQRITNFYSELVEDPAGRGYYIEYYPAEPFNYGESVNLFIYGQDLSSNHNELPPDQRNYHFVCELDTIPPAVLLINPGFGDLAYPNTVLYAEFWDFESGIDTNATVFKINNERIINYEDSLSDKAYTIKYTPDNPFDHGLLLVSFSISDKVHNSLDTSYVVYVVPDTFPPYIVTQQPLANARGVETNSELIVDVLDKGVGLDRESIEFYVNEQQEFNFNLEYNPYHFDPDSLGYRLKYVLPESFYPGQFITIRIKAQDLANSPVANQLDTTYGFTMKLPEEDIAAIPPIIHPGYGNSNQESKIWIHSDASIDEISAKIFNIRGKPVKELDIIDSGSDTKLAIWDGRDENNLMVTGGVYIFQVKIKGKITQGSVTVVR